MAARRLPQDSGPPRAGARRRSVRVQGGVVVNFVPGAEGKPAAGERFVRGFSAFVANPDQSGNSPVLRRRARERDRVAGGRYAGAINGRAEIAAARTAT